MSQDRKEEKKEDKVTELTKMRDRVIQILDQIGIGKFLIEKSAEDELVILRRPTTTEHKFYASSITPVSIIKENWQNGELQKKLANLHLYFNKDVIKFDGNEKVTINLRQLTVVPLVEMSNLLAEILTPPPDDSKSKETTETKKEAKKDEKSGLFGDVDFHIKGIKRWFNPEKEIKPGSTLFESNKEHFALLDLIHDSREAINLSTRTTSYLAPEDIEKVEKFKKEFKGLTEEEQKKLDLCIEFMKFQIKLHKDPTFLAKEEVKESKVERKP